MHVDAYRHEWVFVRSVRTVRDSDSFEQRFGSRGKSKKSADDRFTYLIQSCHEHTKKAILAGAEERGDRRRRWLTGDTNDDDDDGDRRCYWI